MATDEPTTAELEAEYERLAALEPTSDRSEFWRGLQIAGELADRRGEDR